MPLDRGQVDQPGPTIATAIFSSELTLKAVKSFPPGSSGGPDGLSPLHLRDLISADGDEGPLLLALSSLTNLIISGGVPLGVRPFLFGGRLIALNKKGGGLRPIVIGLTLRRVASKLVCSAASEKLASVLSPLQLGVGVSGGMEAAVHASRMYQDNCLPNDKILAKIDFSNAFNSLRRDCFLRTAATAIPEWYPFLFSAYANTSLLFWGEATIESEEGVQQGDPVGPLLFSLATLELLSSCACEFKVGYLDDLTIGDDPDLVAQEILSLRERAALMGLNLNEKKCEVISIFDNGQPQTFPCPLDRFKQVDADEGTLLG